MRTKVKILKVQEERDGPLTQSRNTPLRVRKTRKLGHVDPRAMKRRQLRRTISKANTRQKRGINLKAAAKAETRVGGQKAERRLTSTKVMTEEVAQGAKTEMLKKRRIQKLITVKIEVRVMSLIKSIKKMPEEKTVRKLGQSHKARKEQQKMDVDPVVEIGTGIDLQNRKKRAESGADNLAGVGKGDRTAKGRIRIEEHPEIRNVEQEAQTGTSLEIRTEAGDPGARAIRETTAKIGHLIERTETEKLQAKEGDTAAVLTVTETREGSVGKAQIPNGAGREASPDPKREEAPSNRDQTVQKARGINPALAQAQTATDIQKEQIFFEVLILYPLHMLYATPAFPSRLGL